MSPSSPAQSRDRVPVPAFPYLTPAAGALAALRPAECRWPLGLPAEADFTFCRAPRLARGPYCALHAGRARAPGTVAARRAEALS